MPSPAWRRVGSCSASRCTWPTRWRAVAAGTRSCATASAEGEAPRRRDVVAAWVAGAGAGGVVSARGGDAVRVLAARAPDARRELQRRAADRHAGRRGARGSARSARRSCCSRSPPASGRSSARRPTTVLYVLGGAARRRRRVPARPPRRPRAPLPHARRPGLRRAAATRAPTRATCCRGSCASRVLRLAALACFLAAFGLPATPAAVLLVVFAQTQRAARSVLAGVRRRRRRDPRRHLRAGHRHARSPPAQIAAFFVGTSTVLTVVGTALALAICSRARLRPRRRRGRASRPAA